MFRHIWDRITNVHVTPEMRERIDESIREFDEHEARFGKDSIQACRNELMRIEKTNTDLAEFLSALDHIRIEPGAVPDDNAPVQFSGLQFSNQLDYFVITDDSDRHPLIRNRSVCSERFLHFDRQDPEVSGWHRRLISRLGLEPRLSTYPIPFQQFTIRHNMDGMYAITTATQEGGAISPDEYDIPAGEVASRLKDLMAQTLVEKNIIKDHGVVDTLLEMGRERRRLSEQHIPIAGL